jgi:hypothetical protein
MIVVTGRRIAKTVGFTTKLPVAFRKTRHRGCGGRVSPRMPDPKDKNANNIHAVLRLDAV